MKRHGKIMSLGLLLLGISLGSPAAAQVGGALGATLSTAATAAVAGYGAQTAATAADDGDDD